MYKSPSFVVQLMNLVSSVECERVSQLRTLEVDAHVQSRPTDTCPAEGLCILNDVYIK